MAQQRNSARQQFTARQGHSLASALDRPSQDGRPARNISSAHTPAMDFPTMGEPRSAVFAGERLRLQDWLQVSWFFPEGFVREAVEETPGAWVVHGSGLTYRFLKDAGASGQMRWIRACEEILDNRELAPGLYLGLRTLSWIDDQPSWSVQVASGALHKASVPQDLAEVALVLKRVPPGALLEDRLGQEELDEGVLRGVAAALARFHRSRRSLNRKTFVESSEQKLEKVRTKRLERLRQFVDHYGGFTDPFSRLALLESKAFVESLLAEEPEFLLSRGKHGFIGEVHGSLRAEHVAVERLAAGAPKIALFGRTRVDGLTPVDDLLSDLASLTVDLEVKGHGRAARTLERYYFELFPEVKDRTAHLFYQVSAALRRAEESMLLEGEEGRSARFLSHALCAALGLSSPFIVGIGGASWEGRKDLTRSFAELSGAALLEGAPAAPGMPEELPFHRLCDEAKDAVRRGSAVVIDWPFNRAEERFMLSRSADALGVPVLLVQCRAPGGHSPPAAAEAAAEVRRFARKPQTLWSEDRFTSGLNYLILETGLAQPELALMVLRELARLAPGARHGRSVGA